MERKSYKGGRVELLNARKQLHDLMINGSSVYMDTDTVVTVKPKVHYYDIKSAYEDFDKKKKS